MKRKEDDIISTETYEGERIWHIIPAFDIFGFANDKDVLNYVLKNVPKQNIILLTNNGQGDNLSLQGIEKIQVPIYNGDYLNKYLCYLTEVRGIEGLIVFLLPCFPFRSHQHICGTVCAFKKTNPSFLISMNVLGNDAEAIYLIRTSTFVKSNNFFSDPCNAFVYMVDNMVATKTMDSKEYVKSMKSGVQRINYSTEKQKALAAKYRDNLKDYDLEFSDSKEITDPIILRSSKDAPQRISRLVGLKKGKKILDIGCSSGNITIRYARNADSEVKIVAIDIDKELIETARRYLQGEPQEVRNKITFINTSIEEFQSPPESFDTITSTEFFEHILHTEHDVIMKRCLKFLRPDGNFIVSVPNRFVKDIYNLQHRYRWDWFNHYTHFTKKSLEYFLSSYFKKINFYTIYHENPEEGIFLIAEGVGKR